MLIITEDKDIQIVQEILLNQAHIEVSLEIVKQVIENDPHLIVYLYQVGLYDKISLEYWDVETVLQALVIFVMKEIPYQDHTENGWYYPDFEKEYDDDLDGKEYKKVFKKEFRAAAKRVGIKLHKGWDKVGFEC